MLNLPSVPFADPQTQLRGGPLLLGVSVLQWDGGREMPGRLRTPGPNANRKGCVLMCFFLEEDPWFHPPPNGVRDARKC